jgi:hypothetical protein
MSGSSTVCGALTTLAWKLYCFDQISALERLKCRSFARAGAAIQAGF